MFRLVAAVIGGFFWVCVFSLEGLWTHSQLQKFTYDASFGSWGPVRSNNSLKTKGEHKIKCKHNKRPARRWEKFGSAYCDMWKWKNRKGTHRGSWRSLRSFWSQQTTGPLETTGEMCLRYRRLERITRSIYSLDATRGIRKTLLRIILWHLLNNSVKSASFSCIFRYITTDSVIHVSSQVDAAPPSGHNTLQQYKSPLWRSDSISSWMIL